MALITRKIHVYGLTTRRFNQNCALKAVVASVLDADPAVRIGLKVYTPLSHKYSYPPGTRARTVGIYSRSTRSLKSLQPTVRFLFNLAFQWFHGPCTGHIIFELEPWMHAPSNFPIFPRTPSIFPRTPSKLSRTPSKLPWTRPRAFRFSSFCAFKSNLQRTSRLTTGVHRARRGSTYAYEPTFVVGTPDRRRGECATARSDARDE